MSIITQQQKEDIVNLSNSGLKNEEVAKIIGIHMQTFYYWKRELKKMGYEFEKKKSSGRHKLQYETCETCGQVRKDKPIKKEIPTQSPEVKQIINNKLKQTEEDRKGENRLRRSLGMPPLEEDEE